MQLNINDIAAAIQIIDIVTSRGAFRGDELSQVGALRDKYAAFVQAAQAAEAAESVDTEAPSE
jgi:hypothetical protein